MRIFGNLLWKPRSRADHRGRCARDWGSRSIELAIVTLLPGHRVRAGLPSLKGLWPQPREGWRRGKGEEPRTKIAGVYQSTEATRQRKKRKEMRVFVQGAERVLWKESTGPNSEQAESRALRP